MTPRVRVPKTVAGGSIPCYADASQSTPVEQLEPSNFPNEFSYLPDGLRELEMECPCGDGYLTLTVDEKQKVLKLTTFGCGKDCETKYENGDYDAAILAAVAEAQKIEDAGPTERQLQYLYDTAGSGADDASHVMREARKLK